MVEHTFEHRGWQVVEEIKSVRRGAQLSPAGRGFDEEVLAPFEGDVDMSTMLRPRAVRPRGGE